MNEIGSLNEQPLHAALKDWYGGSGAELEKEIDGYIVDVVRGEQLIEIQTGNFSSIKHKLIHLSKNHPVKLVFPIASRKWLLKMPLQEDEGFKRRKSPKRGSPHEIFSELVSFPELLTYQSFSLELAMIHAEEVRRYTGEKPWYQHGWVTVEQRLVRVVDCLCFEDGQSMTAMLPQSLPDEFTTSDIAKEAHIKLWLAQKMAYCLRKMGAVQKIGKSGRSNLYRKPTAYKSQVVNYR